jgi:hypothetical protein
LAKSQNQLFTGFFLALRRKTSIIEDFSGRSMVPPCPWIVVKFVIENSIQFLSSKATQ